MKNDTGLAPIKQEGRYYSNDPLGYTSDKEKKDYLCDIKKMVMGCDLNGEEMVDIVNYVCDIIDKANNRG